MRIETYLRKSASAVEKALKKYLPEGKGVVGKAMRYSVMSGGKRIRPILTLEASKISGGSFKTAIAAACAVEFVHTYSLIHDDLPAMDDDDFRRGRKTCHKKFGEANAILAGDALLTLAFYILSESKGLKRKMEIIRELSSSAGIDGMILGQAMDMEFKNKQKDRRVSRKISLLKTAALFSASAKIGALTAGAGMDKVKALGRFGERFGLAFQTVDDCLDNEGGDIGEAKRLIASGVRELAVFGKRAGILRELAEYSVKRSK